MSFTCTTPQTGTKKPIGKVRAQVAMVLNLDKCIGCHTCSVTCKNTWTSRPGVEYAWFNNVETKPGLGYPNDWENQEKWRGGWVRTKAGKLVPRLGGKLGVMAKLFGNPHLPKVDDYYEPFTFDYANLQNAGPSQASPTARPRSLITGKRMEKIEKGPNWEEILATPYESRKNDYNMREVAEKEILGQFEQTFMMYLPRLCEHCLNPTCVAVCPSGSVYKREEDGIVLVDQDKCRGWRMCVSGCPYKKMYYNWHTGKAEKCTMCFPRIEAGLPTVCSETCVGRIRYLGVMLYDADRIAEAASTEHETDLYESQMGVFLDPSDPDVIAAAKRDGIPDGWMDSARNSPIYKLVVEWRLALPLHPEYRTLPMVWYVPPLSPIQAAATNGLIPTNGLLPDVKALRIPMRYLANLLTAGDEKPVELALRRMLAMRHFKRKQLVDKEDASAILAEVNLTAEQVEQMYKLLAIANYEDRFVIPTSHKEEVLAAYDERGACGFSFGNGCAVGSDSSKPDAYESPRRDKVLSDLFAGRRTRIEIMGDKE